MGHGLHRSVLAPAAVFAVLCISYSLFTVWIIVTPFIEEDQEILQYIPSPYYGIAAAVGSGVVVFGAVLCSLGILLVQGSIEKLKEVEPVSGVSVSKTTKIL